MEYHALFNILENHILYIHLIETKLKISPTLLFFRQKNLAYSIILVIKSV